MDDYKIKRLLSRVLLGKMFPWKILKLIRSDCEKLSIKSMYDYCLEKNFIVQTLDTSTTKREKRPAITKEEYENWSQKETIEYPISRIYIAEMEDVYIRGLMDGVIKDGYYLTDRVEWDRNGVGLYPPNTGIAMNEKNLIIYDYQNPTTIDEAIFLIKEFSANIFHFTFEALARLAMVDDLEIYDTWPILIDEVAKQDFRTMQLIEAFNVKKHPIIWVNTKEALRVKKLVIPPCLAWGPRDFVTRNTLQYGILMDARGIVSLRNRILKNHIPSKKYNRVLIVRGNEERLTNERAVEEFFREHGFECFNPDKGDFWDEVDCFSTADVIVACAGGAMANVVYSKTDAKIFSICPMSQQSSVLSCFIEPMKLKNMHFVDAKYKKQGKSLNTSQFYLDMSQCEEILYQI